MAEMAVRNKNTEFQVNFHGSYIKEECTYIQLSITTSKSYIHIYTRAYMCIYNDHTYIHAYYCTYFFKGGKKSKYKIRNWKIKSLKIKNLT